LVESNLDPIAISLGITTNSNLGTIHNGAFYTHTCAIYSATFFDSIGEEDWAILRPVRCLTHPNITLSIHTPPVSKNFLRGGISVVAIDIPLLGYQLKQWYLLNQTKPTFEQETISQFITKWVLPGTVREQMDISSRNQMSTFRDNFTLPKGKSIANGVTFSYDDMLYNQNVIYNGYLKTLINTINRSSNTYIQFLDNVPMLFGDTFLNAVPSEAMVLTSSSYWVVLLIYTDWVYSFIDIIKTDQRTVTDISRILKRVERSVKNYNIGKLMRGISLPLFLSWDMKYKKIINTFM
jgi:hypothetical protein